MGGIISVTNLVKTFTDRAVPTFAVRGVTFSISPGEFVLIMGKSGSGKSTLLHQLGLLDNPTSGTIVIDDVPIHKLSDSQKTQFRLKKIGYIFQEYATLPELTALENVCLPANVLGDRPHQEVKETATELLTRIGLGEKLDHYQNQLSGGQQQRVAIARALINRPKIIFADEPTANLDSISALKVMETLKGLNRDFGQTILLVSHDDDDRKWANRVIILKDGLLESSGE